MKTIFENNGGTYEIQGNYLLPNLTLQDEKQHLIGVWGMRHKTILEIKSSSVLSQSTYIKKARQLPCRC